MMKHLFGSKRLRWLGLAILAWGVALLLWQAPVVHQSRPAFTELRGVWLTNYGAALNYYSAHLDEAIAHLAQHHLNTLYPAVWNRGYTLHPSAVAKQAGGVRRDRLTSLPLPFQDTLAGLVHQAHRQHIRLIPWFEYGLMMPVNSAIARQHPDWLTTMANGEQVQHTQAPPAVSPGWLNPLRTLKREMVGADQGWLNPFHPEVQQFMTDLIVEVVQRYPVDGIQLDDHFGLPIEFGYDPYTIERYRQEHGGVAPPSNPADPEWMQWRAERITQFMAKITTAVKAVRPEIIVSLSPNAPAFAYDRYLQDWSRWVEMNLLDEVIVQIYRDDLNNFEAELYRGPLRRLSQAIPLSIGLYTGPFLTAKPMEQIQQEVEIVRKAGFRGVSFFCWETTLWLFRGSSHTQVSRGMEQLFSATKTGD